MLTLKLLSAACGLLMGICSGIGFILLPKARTLRESNRLFNLQILTCALGCIALGAVIYLSWHS